MKLSFKVKAIIISAFLISSVIGSAALETYLDYNDTEERAYKATTDITLVVESQVQDTLKSIENLIDTTSERVIKIGNSGKLQNKDLFSDLKSACVSLTGCEAIGIADTSGKLVIDTANENVHYNISGREFFQEAVKTKRLFIAPAIIARLPNSPPVFVISKPIYNKNSQLLAVMNVAMRTSHLTGFYSLLGFGFAPTVSIFKGNGDIVSRHPGMADHIGKNNSQSRIFTELLNKASSGNFVSYSPLDNKKRLAAYRAVPELDLVIFTGVESPVAFQQWKVRAIRVSLIIGCLLIFTLVAFYLAYRAMIQTEILQIKNEKLDELSNVDELTGIGNRRIFENTLKQEWSRYKRYQVDMAVLLIDVDYFKPYNDNYGHPEGDKTLHKVAQALQECIRRPTDLVARYGGEEFGVIMNTDEAGAFAMAEKIRKKIESLTIKHDFSLVSKTITVSVGIASTTDTQTKNPQELVGEADKALYKAKHAGRNQVAVFKAND